jgi:hypothetical protein
MKRVSLSSLLDAETQCSVCVVLRRMSAAPHQCVVRSKRSYGKNKALVLKRPE